MLRLMINMIKKRKVMSFADMSKNDSKVFCCYRKTNYESGDPVQNIKKIIQSAN